MKSIITPDRAVAFPTRQEGNEMSPLPPDYEELTAEGQRLARLNAIACHKTPEDFVRAWEFFRRTYLFPTPPGMFYGSDLTESPPLHYQIVHSVRKFPLNVWACPRGFAKSTIGDEINLLLSLTTPGNIIALCLASDALVQERSMVFMDVLTEGEELQRDFGKIKGSGTWNQHLLQLSNGSRIRGFSVGSKKRGTKPRPRFVILDDPEYDTSSSSDTKKIREDFEALLFRVLLNMTEKNVRMLWTGTMISKQTSLWAACKGDDPRFRKWRRKIVSVYTENDKGVSVPTWKNYFGHKEIQKKKDLIGAAAFATEYLNRPGVGVETTFPLDPEHCYYYIDGDIGSVPHQSDAPVSYNIKIKGQDQPQKTVTPLRELLSKMTIIGTVDYAPTVSKHSDYSSVIIQGFQSPGDILWVLDCFVGKVKDAELARIIWKMGQKWRPRVIGIEAVSLQQRFYEMVDAFFSDNSRDGLWTPKVFPIRYPGNPSKTDKIAGMQWRFTSHRIKFPGHLRQAPHWKDLFHQVEEFQAEAKDGNLQHDDAVDALAMYQFVLRNRGAHSALPAEKKDTPVQRLQNGEVTDSMGLPLVLSIDPNKLTREEFSGILEAYYDAADQSNSRRLLGTPLNRHLATRG